MKVLHVITALRTGGAQTVLYRVLASLGASASGHAVVCLGKGHPLAGRIRALGVDVWVLDGQGRLDGPRVLRETRSLAREYQPDVILGWMYDGNLAAYWAARGCGAELVWNIRHSVVDLRQEPLGTRIAIRLNIWFARAARIILCNSQTALLQHIALGFPAATMRYVPNGYDMTQFSPGEHDRARVREELGISENAFVIGKIARFHPMKDHANLLEAAARLVNRVPDVQLLFAGRGVDAQNETLKDAIAEHGLQGRVQLLGERSDVPALNAAFDVAVSASAWGEGFSNAIAEALACGTPVVATDVGEAAGIVGDCGIIVPPGSAQALADALLHMQHLGPAELRAMGERGRERIAERYGVAHVARRYEEILHAVAQRHSVPA